MSEDQSLFLHSEAQRPLPLPHHSLPPPPPPILSPRDYLRRLLWAGAGSVVCRERISTATHIVVGPAVSRKRARPAPPCMQPHAPLSQPPVQTQKLAQSHILLPYSAC